MRETNDRGVTRTFRFKAQEYAPLLLGGSALWGAMTLSTSVAAPTGRRLENVLAPILGADLTPGSGGSMLGRLYDAQVNTGPNPRRF